MLNKLHQQLIHLVSSEEGASRADLARLTGMSKAAIGALVKEMLADGLLQGERYGRFRRSGTPLRHPVPGAGRCLRHRHLTD